MVRFGLGVIVFALVAGCAPRRTEVRSPLALGYDISAGHTVDRVTILAEDCGHIAGIVCVAIEK